MSKVPILLIGNTSCTDFCPVQESWVTPGFFIWEGKHYGCKAYVHKIKEFTGIRVWMESQAIVSNPPEAGDSIQLTDDNKIKLFDIKLSAVDTDTEFGKPEVADYYVGKLLDVQEYGPCEFLDVDVYEEYSGEPLVMKIKWEGSRYFFYTLDDSYFYNAYYAIRITDEELKAFMLKEIDYKSFLARDKAYVFIFDSRDTFELDGWRPSHVYYLEAPERIPDKYIPNLGIYFKG